MKQNTMGPKMITLLGVSDIFYFFLLGEGRGIPRRQAGRGDRFFSENPGGGSSRRVRGREGVCGESGNYWGGGGG